MSLYLGADLGTSGLRVVVLDGDGNVHALVRRPFEAAEVSGLPAGEHEQRVRSWREALRSALREVTESLPADEIAAIACDGTSGTLVLLDENGMPVRPAILYDDRRATEEAEELCLGTSYALPKALWLSRHEPQTLEKVRYLATPVDALNFHLLGELPASDTSSAMKLGADLCEPRWTPLTEHHFAGLLPPLVAPGTVLGGVPAAAAGELGLPKGVEVISGATDGTAGTLASGISEPGDWCGILGTTLVVRGLSEGPLHDPEGRFYNHRHPDGLWMPGGASYTGGAALESAFPEADIPGLVESSAPLAPTRALCYPLGGTGERFPFNAPRAREFWTVEPVSEEERAASILQSLAFLERRALDLAKELGAPTGGDYRIAGRTAGVGAWARLRAEALGRPVIPLPQAESSVGAAMLAAAGAEGINVAGACHRLAPSSEAVEPDPERAACFEEAYETFLHECERHFS